MRLKVELGGNGNAADGPLGAHAIADDEPAVTIEATTPNADETGPANGVFTVTRAGSLVGDLTVNIMVGGTADDGTDYGGIGTSVVILDTRQTIRLTCTFPSDGTPREDDSCDLFGSG